MLPSGRCLILVLLFHLSNQLQFALKTSVIKKKETSREYRREQEDYDSLKNQGLSTISA